MAKVINRKEVTDFIVGVIDEIIPDGFNKKRTQRYLDSLSDEDFANLLKALKEEKQYLSIIEPNGSDVTLNIERNLDVAEKYGIKFFKRVYLDSPDGRGRTLSHHPAMILRLPCRRQSQLLVKKQSIPTHNRGIDAMTGQPAGRASKSAQISLPELQMLLSLGLIDSAVEFLKYRGGDSGGFQASNVSIIRTGAVSQKAIEPYATGVKSTNTLSHLLTAMMLRNTL